MHIISKIKRENAQVNLGTLEKDTTACVVSMRGTMDTENAEYFFVQNNQIESWISQQNNCQRIVFDLYDIEYINSTGVGYLMQFLMKKRDIPATYVFNRESLVYFILDNLGFFEFHDLHIQEHSLEKGLEELPIFSSNTL